VPYDEEARVKRAMVQHAAQVVAVTGSEKLGAADRYVVGPLSAPIQLVTDYAVDDAALAPFRDQGVTVIQT
jgi:DeoR/GlpR family transcriptional regulator of sugar metabolism